MSPECTWLTIVQLLLPVLCVVSFCRYAPRYGLAWAGVAGIASYQLILFTLVVVTGSAGQLYPPLFRAEFLGVFGVVLLSSMFAIRPLVATLAQIRYRPQWSDIPLVCACLLTLNIWVAQLFGAWRIGPFEYDAISYHIPRTYIWSWQGSFTAWTTAVWQQVGSAIGGAATLLPSVLLGCGHITFSWSQSFYAFGAGLAVFVIGRSLRMSPRAAFVAAVAFLSFPTVSLRVYGVNSDIAAAFPVIAAVAMFLSLKRAEAKVFVFLVLAGLGIACKQYAGLSAAALALVLFASHWGLLCHRRVMLCGLGGLVVAALLVVGSYYPVYAAFGDIFGGPHGVSHSTLTEGWVGMRRSFAFQLIHWLSEPLSFFTESATKESWFRALGFARLYQVFGLSGGIDLIPSFNGNDLRSGFLPLIALPFLVAGVKRGYRWISLVGVLAFLFIQVAPLAVIATGRFVVVPLAAFALLWGARAERYPMVIALCLIVALWFTRHHANVRRWWPNTSLTVQQSELECSELPSILEGQKLLLLTRPLAADAFVIGRFGAVSFEYVSCPSDGDWQTKLRSLRDDSAWFAMHPESTMVPGPTYQSKIGSSCEGSRVSLDQMKGWLDGAGWRFSKKLPCGIELYHAERASSIPERQPVP